jgi:hypothetical protein
VSGIQVAENRLVISWNLLGTAKAQTASVKKTDIFNVNDKDKS